MLKVYHAPNTRSLRVLWLLEELGTPYEKATVEFSPAYLQSPEYLAVNPLGKLPAIDDEGLILNESGAIVQYILAKHAGSHLEPQLGTPTYGKYLQWLHFAEASYMPPLSQYMQHTFRKPKEERVASLAAEAQTTLGKMLSVLDKSLASNDFICGDTFTAADVMLGYDLHLSNLVRLPLEPYANVTAYFERLKIRPAYQKASA